MINKRSIWFLTLFSLILVLSVYYITMPSELLINTNNNYTNTDNTNNTVSETTYLVSLRVSNEEELLKEMENLKLILTNDNSSINEKNEAYNKMKKLNFNKAEEEKLEKIIKESFNLDSFVKIKGNEINIVVSNKENNNDLANKIMRKIQENYEEEKYITVKFVN